LVVEPDGLLRPEESGRVQVAVVLVPDRPVERFAEPPPRAVLEDEQAAVLPGVPDRAWIRDRGGAPVARPREGMRAAGERRERAEASAAHGREERLGELALDRAVGRG